MKMLKHGATYKYHSQTGVFMDMQIIKGVATIFLQTSDTQEVIKKDFQKIEEWMPEFIFISAPTLPATVAPTPSDLPVLQENNLIKELQENLMDDIKRVRDDKAYIPQAKQACNTTNTLLNLVKIQIQLNRRG
jgi:predicted metallo-beta-lactamase superfamily hydrolase